MCLRRKHAPRRGDSALIPREKAQTTPVLSVEDRAGELAPEKANASGDVPPCYAPPPLVAGERARPGVHERAKHRRSVRASRCAWRDGPGPGRPPHARLYFS
jgi:hypothetical protein